MRLSIVATLYESEPYLDEFHARLTAATQQFTDDYEIVFVNDGSPDASLEKALALHRRDEHVTVIDLSRNFGHHRAIMTGLAHACGELVFLLDSDLEEDPGLLPAFLREQQSSRADVVYGVQQRRKGRWFERITGAAFYSLFNALSRHALPANLVTMRLMTRRYVRALLRHQERELLIAGLWVITGFKQVPFPIEKKDKGRTTYALKHKVAHLVDSITSFSNRPLVFIFYLGMLISLAAGAAAVYMVIRRLFFNVLLAGWPSLIVSIWFLGGLTMLALGVIGIYLAKVFTETKRRPYTIVRDLYECKWRKVSNQVHPVEIMDDFFDTTFR